MTAGLEPLPGSREAVAEGCRCPVLDNAHGLGRGGNGARNGWIITVGCPLHSVVRHLRSEGAS